MKRFWFAECGVWNVDTGVWTSEILAFWKRQLRFPESNSTQRGRIWVRTQLCPAPKRVLFSRHILGSSAGLLPDTKRDKGQTLLNSQLPQQSVSSVASSCLTLCNPMDCSTPGFPVHHQFPEFTQTHVHRIGDAIQPSHPLSSPSPPTFNLSQH